MLDDIGHEGEIDGLGSVQIPLGHRPLPQIDLHAWRRCADPPPSPLNRRAREIDPSNVLASTRDQVLKQIATSASNIKHALATVVGYRQDGTELLVEFAATPHAVEVGVIVEGLRRHFSAHSLRTAVR
jgi:hypothetical protein